MDELESAFPGFPNIVMVPSNMSQEASQRLARQISKCANKSSGMTLRDWLVGQVISDCIDGYVAIGNTTDRPKKVIDLAEGIADEYLRRRAERIEKLKQEAEGGSDEQP